MNERCIELAKQAGLKKEHGSDREYMDDFDWREYGELIVRECADVAHKYILKDGSDFPIKSVSYRIKEHFGVKK